MERRRESPRDLCDFIGGWLEGEFEGEDFWVASGFEHEKDNPDRYEKGSDGRWYIKE